MTDKTDKKLSLEQALTELDTLVKKMEQDELELEQALKDFERGIRLTRHCQSLLTTAEQKVQLLLQTEGEATLTSYDEH